MAEDENKLNAAGHVYCLFCETGEEGTVEQLCRLMLGVEALTLRTERYRIWRGARKLMTQRLLPGYVFVYSRVAVEPYRFRAIEHVIRALVWSDEPELHAEDLRFAHWVRACGGTVSVSKAYREGDRVVIVQGPLKQYEGEILWVDKRKGKAKVRVRTESMDLVMWMFFDYVQLSGERGAQRLEGWKALEDEAEMDADVTRETDAGVEATETERGQDAANADAAAPPSCGETTNVQNTEGTADDERMR